MAIEKGLYAAPEGIDAGVDEETPDLEIEIVDPEMVTMSDGSVEITIIPDAEPTDMLPFDANLAEALEDSVLAELADELVGLVSADYDSRKDWADSFVKGLDVLGFKYEERTEPWMVHVVCTPQSSLKQLYASKQKPCLRRSLPLGR
jgi:hypothetical protein